jgi:manganese transport protein
VLALVGDSGVLPLLVASQVVLSLQLPFAIVPLIRFTSHKPLMGAFTNSRAVRGCAWMSAACITALNSWLIMQTIAGWHNAGALLSVVILIALGCGAFLVWITLVPLGRSNHR